MDIRSFYIQFNSQSRCFVSVIDITMRGVSLLILSVTILGASHGGEVPQTSSYCKETCIEECTCPERVTCTATEKDCGPSQEVPEGHCDPDRICVAENCQCKYISSLNN